MLFDIRHNDAVGRGNGAFIRCQLAGQQLHQGTFPAAVMTNQADFFSLIQGDRNIG